MLVLIDPGNTKLLVTGPSGQVSGQEADGTVVQDIPGSVVFPSLPLVLIADPALGNYTTSVTGNVSGTYVFETASVTLSQTLGQQAFTGTLAAGQSMIYTTALDATASSPQTTSPPTNVIGEQVVFRRKQNKKGKPVGKPVLVGYMLEFSGMLSPSDAGNKANYQAETVSIKRVKKKIQRTFHPIVGFSVSYNGSSDSVTLTFAGKPNFQTGGQITVLAGVTGASGAELGGNTTFTIAPKGRVITPA